MNTISTRHFFRNGMNHFELAYYIGYDANMREMTLFSHEIDNLFGEGTSSLAYDDITFAQAF
jgi:hypothetical protein